MHFYFLKSNTHINKHLQSSYNKYGKDSFLFEVLLLCDKETLTFFEQLLVDGLDPEYNICKECVDSPKGRVVSEETKQKRREAGKFNTMGRPPGFVVSEETRQKMSKSAVGKHTGKRTPHSDEAKRKMSEAGKGKHSKKHPPISEETRVKMSKAQKGRVITEETKQRMSAGMREVWRKYKEQKQIQDVI